MKTLVALLIAVCFWLVSCAPFDSTQVSIEVTNNNSPIDYEIFWTEKHVEINDIEVNQANSVFCVGSIWSIKNNKDLWIGSLNAEGYNVKTTFCFIKKTPGSNTFCKSW